jgi:cytochrome c-type biogenesis protein CcmH/NrfF
MTYLTPKSTPSRSTLTSWRRLLAATTLLAALAVPAVAAAQQVQPEKQVQPAQKARPVQQAQPQQPDPEHGVTSRDPGQVSQLTHQISLEIYSPFCPGKTLAMCPSGGASDVRQEIQVLAREGKDKQAIKEAIIDKYGEEFRLVEPPPEDNYALLSVLAGAFVLCLFAIWFFAARRKTGDTVDVDQEATAPPEEEMSDEEQAYLKEIRGEYMD